MHHPTHTPRTDRAKVVLAWLDGWLPAQLAGSRLQTVYWQARQRTGPPALGRLRLFPGGPTLPVKGPVQGSGDEAHGYTRLAAIVREVVIPAFESGQLSESQVRDVQQRLRGDFAQLWRSLEAVL